MTRVVTFDELFDAFEFVSFAPPEEHHAWLCRATGDVCYRSEHEIEEPLPHEIDDPEQYVAIPHRNDLDLGTALVLRFAREVLPDDEDTVRRTFRRRGAHARAKALFERRGVLQQWYAYEQEHQRAVFREWCQANGLEIAD